MPSRNFDYARHVLRYYRDRPGQDIHYRDAWEALAIPNTNGDNTATFLARTVQRHPDWGFSRTAAGTYRFTPPDPNHQPPNKEIPPMVEIVGFMPDKTTMVVKDESGQMSLWRQVELPS